MNAALQLYHLQNNGAVTPVVLDLVFPTLRLGTGTIGGTQLHGVTLPPLVDVTRAIDLDFRVSPAVNSAVDGQTVVWNLIAGHITAAEARVNNSANWSWPVPNAWLTTEVKTLTFDSGAGVTFPPNTFPPQAFVAFALRRIGSSPLDTFAQQVDLYLSPRLRYTTRYPWIVPGGTF